MSLCCYICHTHEVDLLALYPSKYKKSKSEVWSWCCLVKNPAGGCAANMTATMSSDTVKRNNGVPAVPCQMS